MTDTSAASPTLLIAILSSQCLVWLGLQKILESSATIPMIVHPSPGRTSDLLRAERRPDLFILDAAPTSKIVLLCGLEDKDRTREAFASGVDGIILKVQPPEVVLAVIEALYVPTKPQAPVDPQKVSKVSSVVFSTNEEPSFPLKPPNETSDES